MPVRKCGCSFCQKHAGAWTSHRNAELIVQIGSESMVTKYQFGTLTADFYVCSDCGVVPFVQSEIDGRSYAVVNVNSLHDTERLALSSSETNFDAESQDARLDRRQRNWIADVRIDTGT